MTTIYGIKNCDTMKKAFHWLDKNNIPYNFHDYKKDAPPKEIITQAIKEHGWEEVINRRGTTWRKLPDNIKESTNAETAIPLALENPSTIKRPLILYNNKTYLGFKEEGFRQIFK